MNNSFALGVFRKICNKTYVTVMLMLHLWVLQCSLSCFTVYIISWVCYCSQFYKLSSHPTMKTFVQLQWNQKASKWFWYVWAVKYATCFIVVPMCAALICRTCAKLIDIVTFTPSLFVLIKFSQVLALLLLIQDGHSDLCPCHCCSSGAD